MTTVVTEFLLRGRKDAQPILTTLGVVHGAAPIGLQTGSEIEIEHQDYVVVTINPIVSRVGNNVMNCEITYQVHVIPALTE